MCIHQINSFSEESKCNYTNIMLIYCVIAIWLIKSSVNKYASYIRHEKWNIVQNVNDFKLEVFHLQLKWRYYVNTLCYLITLKYQKYYIATIVNSLFTNSMLTRNYITLILIIQIWYISNLTLKFKFLVKWKAWENILLETFVHI